MLVSVQKTTINSNFYEKIQSSTKLYCGSRSTYIFIYVTFCQSVSISLQVWIDFCGYIWIWNFQSHILLFCFFPKKKVPPFISKYCSHCHILPLTGKNLSQKCFPQILKKHVPNVRLVALGSKDKLHRGFCYRYLETCDSLTKSFTFNLNFLFST